MEKSFRLAEKAGHLLGECLGGAVVTTSYSQDHNDLIWELSGYPIYGTHGTGKVYIVFPAKTFYVRAGDVKYCPMAQDQVRLCQGSLDKPLAHPHIYSGSAHPCWSEGTRASVADFLATLIETLTLSNVTSKSVSYGRCASGLLGVGQDAICHSAMQMKRVYAAFRHLPIVKDRVKLTRYINNRWITIVSHLM